MSVINIHWRQAYVEIKADFKAHGLSRAVINDCHETRFCKAIKYMM